MQLSQNLEKTGLKSNKEFLLEPAHRSDLMLRKCLLEVKVSHLWVTQEEAWQLCRDHDLILVQRISCGRIFNRLMTLLKISKKRCKLILNSKSLALKKILTMDFWASEWLDPSLTNLVLTVARLRICNKLRKDKS